tara:strand:- start:303 stop:476 length:174 start_codon:yes stop_codon:yes gene_type:complete
LKINSAGVLLLKGQKSHADRIKNFSSAADEAKDTPNQYVEAVNVLNQRLMKLTLSPD